MLKLFLVFFSILFRLFGCFFSSENSVAEFTSPLISINKEGVFFNELIIKIFQLELLQPEDKSLNAKCPNRQRICACKNDKWLEIFDEKLIQFAVKQKYLTKLNE